jgi:hypothetical protein
MQHFSDQEWEVAKSASRRKAVRFGVGLAVISGKHTEDLSIGPDGSPKDSSAQSLTLLLNRPQREWLPFFKSRILMINQI